MPGPGRRGNVEKAGREEGVGFPAPSLLAFWLCELPGLQESAFVIEITI